MSVPVNHDDLEESKNGGDQRTVTESDDSELEEILEPEEKRIKLQMSGSLAPDPSQPEAAGDAKPLFMVTRPPTDKR